MIFSKGSGLNDSVFGKSQEPIRAIIEQGVEAFEQNSLIKEIYNVEASKNFAERYTIETSLGDFQNVGENGAYPETSIQEGFSKVIEPATWKSRFEVTQEMIEDAKHSKIKSRANIFTTSYGRTREKYGASLLAGGTAKSVSIDGVKYDTTSADGQPMFSQTHKSIAKAAADQSNLFTGTFATDFNKILDGAQERMQDFKDDNGNLLNVAPDTIIIPNSGVLKRRVFAAVGSDKDPQTSTNAMNFQMGLWNILVWPYLPKTIGGKPYFFLMDGKFNKDYMCLPWLDRVPLTVKSDIDGNTDANIFKGRARFGAGFNNWRCLALIQDGGTGTSLD